MEKKEKKAYDPNPYGFSLKIQTQIAQWKERVRKALAKVESDIQERSVDLSEVILPRSASSDFLLLTWKSWCLQYSITPEFILEALFEHYAKVRRPPRKGVTLGLAIPAITGEAALKVVQNAIDAAYPSSENVAARKSRMRAKMIGFGKPRPIITDDPEEYVKQYNQAVTQKRKEYLAAPKQYRRAWRGNPWRD